MKAVRREITVLTLEDEDVCPLFDLCELYLKGVIYKPARDGLQSLTSLKHAELEGIAQRVKNAILESASED